MRRRSRQTVQVNGNNGKITEIGQVEENTSKVPAIENEKNKHLDEQDHMTTIYASCLSDELVTHQREGLLDTSYEIKWRCFFIWQGFIQSSTHCAYIAF
jgi:hypothetical protein